MRERLEPQLLVALEDLVGNVRYERARDLRRRVAEHVGRDAAREERVRRLVNELAVLRGNALGELLPAGERHDRRAVAVCRDDVADVRLGRDAGEPEVALETRALVRRRAEELELPHAERERESARELLVAAPEREAARNHAEEEGVYDPEREAREDDGVGHLRDLDLVVEPRFTPRLDEEYPPEPAPEAEARRVYVAA